MKLKLIAVTLKCCVVAITLFFTSCATIVSKSKWPVSFESTPDGAKVTITNKHGNEVFNGKTPTAIKLKSGAGFFSKESYTVTFSMPGYEAKTVNLECGLNGWYFGNLLLGGFLGLLIIDPATGAMYRLKQDDVSVSLDASNKTTQTHELRIYNLNDVPEDVKKNLVAIK